ncbi:MAG: 5'-nucleotidase, lipoprotein e(P4) family, partial [Halobacteriovoraceae bacterium]|nr:5'-nucleotidase, lipoprotein e(P4) family [Halobacteriovoraceae bacterium]
MRTKLNLFFVVLLLGSCAHNPQEPFLKGTLYFQQAAEVKALYLQAYNVAGWELERLTQKSRKKYCVVLDVDETVLDNSPYQGWLYHNKTTYSHETWDRWVAKKEGKALPGAVEFIHSAQKMGVKPLLITNRRSHLEQATFENLKAVGIHVSRNQVIGRADEHSKEGRRNKNSNNCEIAMLIGDVLSDFSTAFEGSHKERLENLKRLKGEFGKKYFILPNPMYGDWHRRIGKESLKGSE